MASGENFPREKVEAREMPEKLISLAFLLHFSGILLALLMKKKI
jgi:hypothetical protein